MKKLAYLLFLIFFLSVGQTVLAIPCNDCADICQEQYSMGPEYEGCLATQCNDCDQTETNADGDTTQDDNSPLDTSGTVTPNQFNDAPPAGNTNSGAAPEVIPPAAAPASSNSSAGQKVGEALGLDTISFSANVPIGDFKNCTFSGSATGGNNCLGIYIQAWYGFALGTLGILATFMIMFAGFKYLTSRGDTKAISEAKTLIVSAVSGLILAFLIYTILNIINPNLLIIKMPAIPSIKTTGGMDLSKQTVNDNTNETDGTTSTINPLVPANMQTSQNYPKLTGREDLVNSGNALIDQLKQENKLPPGFKVTSGYRCTKTNSQHCAGNAFDVTWDGINQQSAETFANNVIAINPKFSYIIESDGEYGSSWHNADGSPGMGVHLDLRTNMPPLRIR